ncbi:MAG TPA: hypothetical protein VE869_08860 [Gemmatimonas sp.]|nr:hypothetical protein [Gemmatimonas sp.]
MCRITVAVAVAEPRWFLLVIAALIGGGAAAVVHLEPRRLTFALGAMAVVVALLTSVLRRDARLHRIIGISPRLVRVVESLLWSWPFIGVAAISSLRDGAVITGSVAAVGFLSVETSANRAARRTRRALPMVPTTLPEWTVGLRRSAPIIVAAVLGGIAGSGSPGIVVLTLLTLSLTTSAYFCAPAEGWLLLHASGQRAGRFLSRKLLASVGLLSAMVVPIVLLSALRSPQFALVYLLALVICLHAHAAAVLVKYAAYRVGQPLDAIGTLLWIITDISILVPPVGIVLLVWLYRRASARLADVCPSA